jgi:phage/plasmid primase-like uncharacterized protein
MSDFIAFARGCGLDITAAHPSDRIRRCATLAHPNSKNGAYLWDGERGWAMAWDGDGEIHWFGGSREWTEDDKAKWKAERDRERAKSAHKHEQAAKRAAELLRDCELRPHGYLKLKGFPEHKALCLSDDTLVVPMRDVQSNALRGTQMIRWLPDERRWEKKMLPGMRAKGAVLRLGPPKSRETILCEGYATGLSIEAAANQLRLNASVFVCFSDSNMVHVAPFVRRPAYVFADNDASEAGERAAKATRLPYCMADVVGWDANDLHHERGLMAVCSALHEARIDVGAAA